RARGGFCAPLPGKDASGRGFDFKSGAFGGSAFGGGKKLLGRYGAGAAVREGRVVLSEQAYGRVRFSKTRKRQNIFIAGGDLHRLPGGSLMRVFDELSALQAGRRAHAESRTGSSPRFYPDSSFRARACGMWKSS